MLGDVRVREEINKLKEIKSKSIMLNEDDIIERYMKIAFADMTDFVEWGQEERIVIGDFGTPVEIKNPITGEKDLLKEKVNVVKFKDSNLVDGGLVCQIKQGKDGASVKLEDRQKALDWLSKFFEMNPESKHRKEYDNNKFRLDRSKFEHTKKIDNKKIELEEKKLNTDTKNEDRVKAIEEYLEATRPNKEFLDSVFDDENEEE